MSLALITLSTVRYFVRRNADDTVCVNAWLKYLVSVHLYLGMALPALGLPEEVIVQNKAQSCRYHNTSGRRIPVSIACIRVGKVDTLGTALLRTRSWTTFKDIPS